jgi:hypothetical protein
VNDIEGHRGTEQAERERHQLLVQRVAEQADLALHGRGPYELQAGACGDLQRVAAATGLDSTLLAFLAVLPVALTLLVLATLLAWLTLLALILVALLLVLLALVLIALALLTLLALLTRLALILIALLLVLLVLVLIALALLLVAVLLVHEVSPVVMDGPARCRMRRPRQARYPLRPRQSRRRDCQPGA